MQKIHVPRECFEATGPYGDLIEKKTPFLDKVNGNICAKFPVCIVFRLTRRHVTNTYTHIQVKIGISKTGCSPRLYSVFVLLVIGTNLPINIVSKSMCRRGLSVRDLLTKRKTIQTGNLVHTLP